MAPHPSRTFPDASLPRASDGMLAMIISISALLFSLRFVAPFTEPSALAADAGGILLRVVLPVVLAAIVIERLVEIARKRGWRGNGRTREDSERSAFLALCILGVVAALAGVRTLEPLLRPGILENLSAGRVALVMWTDVVITTGLVAGLADGFHRLLHAGAHPRRGHEIG
jgi:hypothetical protein